MRIYARFKGVTSRSEGFPGTGYLVPARGLGAGWEIHVSSAVAAAAPGLDPQKRGFVG